MDTHGKVFIGIKSILVCIQAISTVHILVKASIIRFYDPITSTVHLLKLRHLMYPFFRFDAFGKLTLPNFLSSLASLVRSNRII